MTAIIIVVVVALVFFVSICVITFMVWKHETEMRTDSLKAIEQRLESLSNSLSDDGHVPNREAADKLRGEISQITQERRHLFRQRGSDPFDWMRTGREDAVENDIVVNPKVIEETIETAQPILEDSHIIDVPLVKEREIVYDEIDLEFAEIKNLVSEIKQARDEELQKLEDLQVKEVERPEEVEIPEVIEEPVVVSEPEEPEKVEEPEKLDESEMVEEFLEYEDFIDLSGIEELGEHDELPDFDESFEESNDDFNEVTKVHLQYDIGRSGKKYTAEELEMLIKE